MSMSNRMRPSMSPLMVTSDAVPLGRYACSSMLTSSIRVLHWSVSASTASAALMNGWINSMRMALVPVDCRAGNHCVIAHYVLDDFVENLGLDRLLHEVTRALLQGSHDVLLVA